MATAFQGKMKAKHQPNKLIKCYLGRNAGNADAM
jgi:hypothetical protein